MLGPGSVGVLAQLIAATCDPGDEVVFAWRSFEAYPILVTLAGAAPVQVPLAAGDRHDLDAMAEAITPRTRMVLVCTPNNPTGTTVGDTRAGGLPRPGAVGRPRGDRRGVPRVRDGVRLPRRARPRCGAAERRGAADLLEGLRARGAAGRVRRGARAGGEALRKAAIPFGVNSLAQAAAVASLEAFDELEVRVKEPAAERERVAAALRAQGWTLPDAQANFVWFGLGSETGAFAAACQDAGLTVRPYGADGARATIGEREANDRLIEVAGAFFASRWG